MLGKGKFFDLLNRREGVDFETFLNTHRRYQHYIDLHGYVLPFDYGDPQLEYRAIRNGCAMFDATSSRKYRVRGRRAGAFLDCLLTRPVSASPPMRGIYAVFCNDDGSVKDDVVVYKYAHDDYLVMPAFHHDAYFEAVRTQRSIEGVHIDDCSDALLSVSVQGPWSATVLQRAGCDGIEHLKPFDIAEYRLSGGQVRVARMGFTGDLGYECWFEPQLCEEIAQRIEASSAALDIEVIGYGLSALEPCRLEAGLIVPGRECATEYSPLPGMARSPFDLNLGWLVKFDGRDFIGREALQAEKERGASFAVVSFEVEGQRRLPRGGRIHATVADAEVPIGVVTSSSWSWGLNRTIGLASLQRRHAECREAHVHGDKERIGVRLSQGRLLDLPRRTQVPAPIVVPAT